jgi:ketosteroid isomerase-like protein
MQKVVGSSPIIRFHKAPASIGAARQRSALLRTGRRDASGGCYRPVPGLAAAAGGPRDRRTRKRPSGLDGHAGSLPRLALRKRNYRIGVRPHPESGDTGRAISRENVEVVAEILAEFATTHKAVGRLLAPDFVWDMGTFRGWPDASEYAGPDGLDDFFAKWTEPYEDWDMDVRKILDAGGDRVVALVTQRGRLRGADSWVELRFGLVYTLRTGLVSRVQNFASDAEALEAVGLQE